MNDKTLHFRPVFAVIAAFAVLSALLSTGCVSTTTETVDPSLIESPGTLSSEIGESERNPLKL